MHSNRLSQYGNVKSQNTYICTINSISFLDKCPRPALERGAPIPRPHSLRDPALRASRSGSSNAFFEPPIYSTSLRIRLYIGGSKKAFEDHIYSLHDIAMIVYMYLT